MYLIQGFFCQRVIGLGMMFVPVEGAVASVRSGHQSYLFAGTITSLKQGKKNVLTGSMIDELGNADLSDIVITKEEFSFCKKYRRDGKSRETEGIAYSFKPDKEGTWLGEYRLPVPGKSITGPARCILTKVSSKLFQGDLDAYEKKTRHSLFGDASRDVDRWDK